MKHSGLVGMFEEAPKQSSLGDVIGQWTWLISICRKRRQRTGAGEVVVVGIGSWTDVLGGIAALDGTI